MGRKGWRARPSLLNIGKGQRLTGRVAEESHEVLQPDRVSEITPGGGRAYRRKTHHGHGHGAIRASLAAVSREKAARRAAQRRSIT